MRWASEGECSEGECSGSDVWWWRWCLVKESIGASNTPEMCMPSDADPCRTCPAGCLHVSGRWSSPASFKHYHHDRPSTMATCCMVTRQCVDCLHVTLRKHIEWPACLLTSSPTPTMHHFARGSNTVWYRALDSFKSFKKVDFPAASDTKTKNKKTNYWRHINCPPPLRLSS